MILITGAYGFIGKELSSRFLPSQVKLIGRNGLNGGTWFDENFNWENALDDIDTVIHLANSAHGKCNNQKEIMKNNVDTTLHLFDNCIKLGVKKFIYLSTSNKLEFSKNSINYYQTKSKLVVEEKLREASKASNINVVIVRCPLVYGINALGNFKKLSYMSKNLPILPFGLASNKLSIVSVKNLVEFLIYSIRDSNNKFSIHLITDTEKPSIKELTSRLACIYGNKHIQVSIPLQLIKLPLYLLGFRGLFDSLWRCFLKV